MLYYTNQDRSLDASDKQSYDTHPSAYVDSHREKLKIVGNAKVVQALVEEQQWAGSTDNYQWLGGEQRHYYTGTAARDKCLGYTDYVVRLVAHQTAEGYGCAKCREIHENRRCQAG